MKTEFLAHSGIYRSAPENPSGLGIIRAAGNGLDESVVRMIAA
jgi:hypothetical protein